MPVLNVNYDLHKAAERSYEDLYEAIKSASTGRWCRPVESSWFVETQFNPNQFLARIERHLHSSDKVVITQVDLTKGWWSSGLTTEVSEYLKGMLAITY